MQGDILESTLRELELMFQPLSLAATEPDYLVVLLHRLGWSIDDLLPALSGLTAELGGIKDALTEIRAIADGGSVDFALIGKALSTTSGIPAAVRALEQQLTETLPAMAEDLGGLAGEILELLFTDWLMLRSKLTYAALAAIGVITQEVTTEKRDATNRISYAHLALLHELAALVRGELARAGATEAAMLAVLPREDDLRRIMWTLFPKLSNAVIDELLD